MVKTNHISKAGIVVFFLLLTAMAAPALAQNGIIVNLADTACPWAESRLHDKLNLLLSTISQASIVRGDGPDYLEPGPIRTSRLDDLIEYGQNLNGRFLVDIFIERIDLEKRKSSIIPHAISRYQVYGVMEGTIRIVDIKKARLVDLIDFDCSLKAVDRWQFVDDDVNDADLNMAPDKKVLLFDRLEDKAAEEIFRRIKKLSKGINFGK